jgi:hypothetical protein
MMRSLRVVVLVVVFFAATFLVGGILLPSKIHLTVWKPIMAPHDHMSALVATPGSWAQWSALTSLQPYATHSEIIGPKTGVGAAWLLANEKGSLVATITAFEPGARVSYKLSVDRLPVSIAATVDFYARRRGTNLRWTIIADAGKNIGLRWLGLLAKELIKPSYERAIERLALIASERAHEEMQDALAAEESALIRKKAQDN